jgi:hypothetical protein
MSDRPVLDYAPHDPPPRPRFSLASAFHVCFFAAVVVIAAWLLIPSFNSP